MAFLFQTQLLTAFLRAIARTMSAIKPRTGTNRRIAHQVDRPMSLRRAAAAQIVHQVTPSAAMRTRRAASDPPW